MKQMLKRQMKDVPADQREKLIELVTKNPELFQKIAQEAQQKIASGMDQMKAMMSVMQDHQEELQKIVGDK